MGQRATRIYTRTGDDGTTGLGDGSRVVKDTVRVEAMGEVDELNSHIGAVLVHPVPEAVREPLAAIQHDLFHVGGELAVPGQRVMGPAQVRRLEVSLDAINADLPSLREFVVLGGSPEAAACDVARAVCRRAERRLVTLGRTEFVNPHTREYLNRLSDLLFVLARVLTRNAVSGEVLVRPRDKEEGGLNER